MITIQGAIAVKAALASRYRTVSEIIIAKDKTSHDIDYLLKQAKTSHVSVRFADNAAIDELTESHTHGGIAATVSSRRLQAITSLLTADRPFLALVQGVEDSYNLGYIIRTLYAFGCTGLLLNQRSWDFEDATLIRSSAGASELMPIHMISQMDVDLGILKANGVKIVSACRTAGSHSLYQTDLTNRTGLAMAIGGPLRGLSQPVIAGSDMLVYIPYASEFRPALNAASAAAVMAAEIFRQNQIKESGEPK